MNASILKVKDQPNLVKDQVSGAVLNIDHTALAAYHARRDAIRRQQTLETRVDAIESKLDRLIELMHAIHTTNQSDNR